MKRSVGLVPFTLALLAIVSVGCTTAQAPDPSPASPESDSISGTLIGPDGSIVGAEITLKTYRDEACVELAEAPELSDAEKRQLEECSSDYASTTSNADGQYGFSGVAPGWYSVKFTWDWTQEPPRLPAEFRDGFLLLYFETPQGHDALAMGEIVWFPGEEGMAIDFDYGKP